MRRIRARTTPSPRGLGDVGTDRPAAGIRPPSAERGPAAARPTVPHLPRATVRTRLCPGPQERPTPAHETHGEASSLSTAGQFRSILLNAAARVVTRLLHTTTCHRRRLPRLPAQPCGQALYALIPISALKHGGALWPGASRQAAHQESHRWPVLAGHAAIHRQ